MIYSGPGVGGAVGLKANEALTFMELMSRFGSFLRLPFLPVTSAAFTAPFLHPSARQLGANGRQEGRRPDQYFMRAARPDGFYCRR